jgi:hypothetical protein
MGIILILITNLHIFIVFNRKVYAMYNHYVFE